jgi:Predicted membrane protein
MKRLLSLLVLLATVSWSTWADETITISANSEDISQALDLKAVATLFGTVKNVEEFETLLNNPDSAFTNLDLNGDGSVDYLRVVETNNGNKHLVVIQAVLAQDVFQDVASIYVEKDEATGQVSTQVIGDEYVYGANYVIEPVYIYRPYIYDWFWGPTWCCWHSPWYWGYYPHWWYSWRCWPMHRYWDHCYHWHHHHPYCSFRYARYPRPAYHDMHGGVSRRDYATAHHDRAFATRNSGVTNARHLDASRATAIRSSRAGGGVSRQGSTAATRVGAPGGRSTRGYDNTFGSAGVSRSSAVSTRQAAANGRQVSARQGAQPAQRSSSVSINQRGSQRPTAVSQRATTGQIPTATTHRSSGSSSSRPTATTHRSSSSSSSRSGATASTHRSSSSQPAASSHRSSSYSSSSRSSSSSSHSGSSSRSSSSYSGGSSRSSSSSYSGGGRSGGGFSGGGHSSGGHSGGGRSGGGSTRR